MTEINHSKIQYDLSQWKKVVDHAPGFVTQHKNLVDLLDEKYLMEASADTKRSLLIALGQAAESYGLDTIESELNGDQKPESLESSEQPRMTAKQIQQAVYRNTYYKQYNNEEKIREVCSKINYTRENLANGREKHTINGISFSFPKFDEFILDDMIKAGKYTMDIVSENGKNKYKKFQTETGMNKLSPDKVYDILGKFAKAMDLTSTINHNFFKGNSDESQGLWKMFTDITGFEGKLLLNITNKGETSHYLCSRSYDRYSNDYSIDSYVSFLAG